MMVQATRTWGLSACGGALSLPGIMLRFFHQSVPAIFIASLFAISAQLQGRAEERPTGVPSEYQLLYKQDFASPEALKDLLFSDPNAWKLSETEGQYSLELVKQSAYAPPFRSPVNIALVAGHMFEDFILDVECLQTGKEYGHRDMCIYYGFQDPAHFYYTHIATKTDDHAHNCFIVNAAPRTKISVKTTPGVNWGLNVWHKVRLERKASDGTIRVWFDDMAQPIMEAKDQSFGAGWIGLGSFDDTGRVRNLKVWGNKVTEKRAQDFPTKKN